MCPGSHLKKKGGGGAPLNIFAKILTFCEIKKKLAYFTSILIFSILSCTIIILLAEVRVIQSLGGICLACCEISVIAIGAVFPRYASVNVH